jgi:hypothetical protein
MTPCEYFLLLYAASPASELRVPIGLFLFEQAGRLVQFGVTRQWQRVRCLHRNADMELLSALPAYFDLLAAEFSGQPARLRSELVRMSGHAFGNIQVAGPRGVETEDPALEFERLFRQHVGHSSKPAPELTSFRTGSRRWIQQQLFEGLQRHDLLGRMRAGVPVEEFTAPGDAFRIDYAYRPNGVVKFLHAISLRHDWNQAKVLSYTFGRIQQRQPATLTAIVGSDLELESGTCRQILLEAGIVLQPMAGLDGFLEKVRAEL